MNGEDVDWIRVDGDSEGVSEVLTCVESTEEEEMCICEDLRGCTSTRTCTHGFEVVLCATMLFEDLDLL